MLFAVAGQSSFNVIGIKGVISVWSYLSEPQTCPAYPCNETEKVVLPEAECSIVGSLARIPYLMTVMYWS